MVISRAVRLAIVRPRNRGIMGGRIVVGGGEFQSEQTSGEDMVGEPTTQGGNWSGRGGAQQSISPIQGNGALTFDDGEKRVADSFAAPAFEEADVAGRIAIEEVAGELADFLAVGDEIGIDAAAEAERFGEGPEGVGSEALGRRFFALLGAGELRVGDRGGAGDRGDDFAAV